MWLSKGYKLFISCKTSLVFIFQTQINKNFDYFFYTFFRCSVRLVNLTVSLTSPCKVKKRLAGTSVISHPNSTSDFHSG